MQTLGAALQAEFDYVRRALQRLADVNTISG
jgi:hypothetical protein